jgi:NAD+ dependent glucose-6-phosphate dehydrogenase
MAHNVYQVALEEGVQRVVMASSNHAADFYEPLIHSGEFDHVRPDTYNAGARPLADNLYGWAKESYEHLGFLYAVGKETLRPLEVVQIRIGAPQENTLDTVKTLQAMNRYLGAYLSARDCAQIFIKSIETVDIHDEHGVPFQVFCKSCSQALHSRCRYKLHS